MDVAGGVEGLEFALVRREVLVAEIADVDRARTVMSELVGAGAADAEGGIGACLFSLGDIF